MKFVTVMRIQLAGLFAVSCLPAAEVLPLWPAEPPGPAALVDGPERDTTPPEKRTGENPPVIRLGHVARPELHVFLPDPAKATGAAVVICPGGGFSILAWNKEGTEVAEWLNTLGVAGIVLKYRVPTGRLGVEPLAGPGAPDFPVGTRALGPLMDAQRALSITRASADAWKLNPGQIGVMGFSAGGHTAALAVTANGRRTYTAIDAFDQAPCRPDFAMLVYPAWMVDKQDQLLPEFRVDASMCPVLFIHTADDRITPQSSLAMAAALQRAEVPVSLHLYEKGGHGYGLRPGPLPIHQWPQAAAEWLRAGGWGR